jgi:integrase
MDGGILHLEAVGFAYRGGEEVLSLDTLDLEADGNMLYWPVRSGDQALRLGPWRRALRAAGVRYRYPYQMRHTYASMMLSAGENPAWIARQMGHADWGMIRRTYARWMPDVEPNAGEKASSWWANNTAQNLSKPVTKK